VVSFRAFEDTLNLPDIVVPKYLKKPVISPTYMQNIRSIKIADTVDIYPHGVPVKK
jgi:hypothetical protein